ncbi:TPA: LUD domain-containing protein [Candidatus Woesearchaeota archaeon]|nr:LUD domain-containing protein [Candidatus Woesearchaeota archaeon]
MKVTKKIVDHVLKNFEKNNFEAILVKDGKKAFEKVFERVKQGNDIAVGGSTTLRQLGIHEALTAGKFKFHNPYKKGLSVEQEMQERRAALNADYYLTSVNAITLKGELVLGDAIGNRVGSTIYGPKKVIIVVSKNKIVKGIKEAFERIEKVVIPKNLERLAKLFPGRYTKENLWSNTGIIHKAEFKGRFTIILVDEELGY